jgi:tetratricopeptide (TPR) repeat protein
MQKKVLRILVYALIAIAILVGLYFLPPIHSRLAWRVDNLRTQIKYYFNPPDEAIFEPSTPEPTSAIAQATPTFTLTPAGATHTPIPTMTPTIVSTPYPEIARVQNVIYVDQENRWNYCGPSNLTMALKFWGWEGNRDDVAKVVKPGVADEELDFIQRGKTDKNVMPYEMVDFVNEQTEFRALSRYGGEIDLIKRFIAAGYPVLIEKGRSEKDYTGKVAWLGHYQFVTGYNDLGKNFIVQDTYNDGPNFPVEYPVFEEGWRSFNDLFIIVYPPEDEQKVFELLGPWLDETWADQHALEVAEAEEPTLEGNDQFFAIFNQGTSLVKLQRYAEAAAAFDRAFALYAELGQEDTQRPYRIMWYQTSPYWAYFYAGRYQDVINLANTTLNETISEPTLEESLYWRAMAEYAIGDYVNAFADMREAVRLNPNFSPGIFYLEQWGVN